MYTHFYTSNLFRLCSGLLEAALGKQRKNENLLVNVPDVQTMFLVLHDKLYTVLLIMCTILLLLCIIIIIASKNLYL